MNKQQPTQAEQERDAAREDWRLVEKLLANQINRYAEAQRRIVEEAQRGQQKDRG